MIEKTVEILEGIDEVKVIEEYKESLYKKKEYIKVIKLQLKINNELVGIVMAIPTNWKRKLIDFFIEDYSNFELIPHVEENGKVCLFDLEGVLVQVDLEGLVKESINRLKKIICDGIQRENRIDFIEEFESYWIQLPNIKKVDSFVDLGEKAGKIKCITKKNKIDSIANDEKYLNLIGRKGTIKNGIYLNINAKDYIYPPDYRGNLEISYVNNLLKDIKIEDEELIKLIKKSNKEIILLININQPNGIKNPVGVVIELKNKKIKQEESLSFDSGCKCTPLYIQRSDSDYLLGRGGGINNFNNKNILVIGCGSIGGYLISELIKSGISKLTLVDKDVLSSGNICRHLLGIEYVGMYKTKAIKRYFEKNIPFANIVTYEQEIEELIENLELDFEEFDLIISTTGNHNVNRWINEYTKNYKVMAPVVYMWNEVLGIGNHVLLIDNKYEGCFECLISEDENGKYDKTSYCVRGQVFAKKYQGCNSTFLPFGSIHSLKTVSLGIELILKYFNEGLKENLLISQKGGDIYMKKENFDTSDRYKYQKETICKLEGSKFVSKECSICFKP